MTFGEKLAKMRKANNYTQEEFADLLNVSRQTVSKWESDIVYPETDRLIKLSELFGCSLDYLLKDGKPTVPLPSQSDGRDEVSDKLSDADVANDNTDAEKDKRDRQPPKNSVVISAVCGCTVIGCVAVYIILGAVCNLWHPTWIVFLLIPLVATLAEAIDKRKASVFAFPVLIVAAYLLMGFLADLWHPGWVVYLAIPPYYIIADAVEKSGKKKNNRDGLDNG